jgi:hypothetical protein
VASGRPDPEPVGSVLRRMKNLAIDSVGMGFRGSSRIRGRRPGWMRRASDVRFVGISAGTEESTLLHFLAPRFGDVADEVYRQGRLFSTIPRQNDTAFDIMGDIVTDVAKNLRDSDRFDVRVLQHLESFKEPLFQNGVDEIAITGGRLPPKRPPIINSTVADIATSLYRETPAPVRARVMGHLDMIRASDKVFTLNLKDGQRVRGIWLGATVTALKDHYDQDVVVNGMITFRPSGTVLRFDAEAMRAVFGKWPGDETDDEILRTLAEVE